MCHYSHCRKLGQTGKEKEGEEERKESEGIRGRAGWNEAVKGGRRGFLQWTGWRRAELVKSLKMSQTCDSRLLNLVECCLSLVLRLLAFAKCGWSFQWYTQPLHFHVVLRAFAASHRLPLLSCALYFPMWRHGYATVLHSVSHFTVKLFYYLINQLKKSRIISCLLLL